MTKIIYNCPAKINLSLKLIGKTSDGYHELESLFAFLDLNDQLEVQESSQFKIEIDGEFSHLIDPKNNLLTIILDYFSHKFHISKNLHIKLTKNIPVGGGLGGGSSNAAYFMRALNEIFQLHLSKKQLQEISLNFGSDIAFLLENQASLIRGRGEIIKNFPHFSPISALLVNPKINISTKEIFTNFDEKFSAKKSDEEILRSSVFDLIKNSQNDLEKPAIKSSPIIKEILDNLTKNQALFAKMSGSGASCFAIFENEEKLQNAEMFFRQNFPLFFIKKIKILSHV